MMSTNRGSSGGAGVQSIPAGSRKMVQSLKEIVSCSETEIYAALKECNMDPNEAVNRLLSQDPFHEVKSKREKKKEGKDTTESRSRGKNSSRSGKNAVDRYLGRNSLTSYSSSESKTIHKKVADKKENGSTPHTSYLPSTPVVSGSDKNRGPQVLSDIVADSGPSDTQLPSGYQSAWVGAPNQLSMADIVKMGRPYNKGSGGPNTSQYNTTDQNVQGPITTTLHDNLRISDDQPSDGNDPRISSVQQVPTNYEWPSIEKPPAKKILSLSEYHVDSDPHAEPYDVSLNSINQQFEPKDVHDTEEDDIENLGANDVGSPSVASRKLPEDDSRCVSLFENDLHKNTSSLQHQVHDFEYHEDEAGASVSSVTKNMEQLNMDGRGLPSETDAPSVIIPKHLLVQSADCLHLNFGSFGSGITAVHSSGPSTSVPLKTNLDETHSEADVAPVGYSDARNTVYFVDDSFQNTSDGNLFHKTGESSGSYVASSTSQPEDLKQEIAEVAHENQYPFPASNPDYTYNEVQPLNAAFSQSQTSVQMQTLAPFTNNMQAFTNSLPSSLLASNVPSSRESDLQFSSFPMAQSLSAKYGSSVSSIGSSATSMSEALKSAGFSAMQSPSPQAASGTNVATGPPLPQHLAVHPYSQPSLPLGPFANMISYPFLPQSYTYLPSAFQQAFPGNGTYHQSLAGILPQYKNSIAVSSLPQSSTIASSYATFGNSAAIPGNFQMNPPSAASGATLGYDDALGSQYKDNNRSNSLQQSDNTNSWLHGLNSRTISAVPANTFYNYQGQNQPSSGFGQSQQPSQNYGTLGYPNFYHPQTVASIDQQQQQQHQHPREVSLGSSQGQPKLSQIWQNGY